MSAVATMGIHGKRSYSDVDSSPNSSPLKRSTGSPSVRRLAELGFQNERYNRELLSRLEQDELQRGKSHQEALIAAAREHERVRRSAQLEQERNALQLERAKQQQEEAERNALDQERQRQVELEIEETRRKVDEARRLAELQKKADQERAKQEEETRRIEEARQDQERLQQEQQRRRERERRQEDEQRQQYRRQNEEREAANRRNQTRESQFNGHTQEQSNTSAAVKPPNLTVESSLISSVDVREAEHKRYLDLHQRIKSMRASVLEQSKATEELRKTLGKKMGDWRRDIRSRVGQATGDKGGTTVPKNKIVATLTEAMRIRSPTVDARKYILTPLPSGIDAASSQISGVFLYLLNIFTKRIISEWIQVAGADTKAANPAAILAISVFATNEFKWQGIPFFDLLLAKLHKVCPVLFGIHGSDKSDAGRKRLGWALNPEKSGWESEQRHSENMTGLGAGFAAIALRKFPAKSNLTNPYPPSNYWKAFARIINTPASEITHSHLIVLKAMVEHQAERFLEFFGGAAIVALRTAIHTFAEKGPKGPARTAMSTLPAVLHRDYKIDIT